MTKIRLLMLLIGLFTGILIAQPAVSDTLKIRRMTPTGLDVPTGQQIVITFNQPVVPLGRMERDATEIPITITPALQCQWRWLNSTNLACQLDDENALKPATRYEVYVAPGIMTESKQTLNAPFHATFITERPTISYTSFQTWQAPGMPKIWVNFNQTVTPESVAQHLYFQKPNKERVPVRVELPPNDKDEPFSLKHSSAWIVSPQILLPLDTKIILRVESGIQSHIGSERGIEERILTHFHTFPEFKFVGMACTNLNNQSVSIPFHKKKFDKYNRCDPLQGISLHFSSPVIKEVLKEHLLVMPDLAGGRQDYDPWENVSSYSRLDEFHNKEQIYKLWLPGPLKAFHNYQLSIVSPQLFKDEFGRALPEAFDIQFATSHRAPTHVFEHEISVLEKGVDSELPVVVTNLDYLFLKYHFLNEQGWDSIKSRHISIPQVKDIAFRMPLGIRDLIPASSGVVQGYFTTLPNVNNQYAQGNNWFFSQITPYYVQAKLGHHNTLVWVTAFATGLPVSGVEVSIYKDTYAPDEMPEPLTIALTDENGVAWLPGTKTLDPELEKAWVYGGYQKEERFFIQAKKQEDIALLPLDSNFRVYLYDITDDYTFYPQQRQKYAHIHTWGSTAQGVYKVGDTVQYKFFVRDQSNETFVPAPEDGYSLAVIDPMGKVVHQIKDFSLSAFGSYHGEFSIPKTGAVGWYRFELTADFRKNRTWQPMRVLVSDFTPSPFRVQTSLNGELFHAGEAVTINTAATLHAGGPYVNAQTRIHATLSQKSFKPNHPQAKGFEFDVYVDGVDDETVFSAEDKKVNDKGLLQTSFTLSDALKVLYGQLNIESAVRDDRGKDVANSVTARYVGRDRFIGLKETSWVLTRNKEAKVLLLVIDEHGHPIANTDIEVDIERRVTKASRVKGAGNAYLTHYEHEWVDVASCETKSELTRNSCTFIPPAAGAYRITANITDTKGRAHSTQLHQWATGKGYVMWETTPGHGLEIVPEQESYKVGDVARYLVKNPYPGVQALITVERFGTIKSWVQSLEKSLEIIEIPVEPNYAPGFFVSVTVMSPRVQKPIDENQVDLGKPAFRMGYVQTNVREPYKELLVDIKTDKPVYKPREQVTIDLQAKPRHPSGQDSKIELAVTVLDESVFDLLAQGRDYFDPYKGFYTLDDLDMANFSLMLRLVGRQKFEKKGANAGGDGGSSLSMRSLFKFVSYWNPAIETDAEGKAQIQFTVPDNLTGWRVLVMAVTPGDRMGLGDANFKVNQPIEIRPALPNQVLSGDRFHAGFTIMNRTDKLRDLNIILKATGPINNDLAEYSDMIAALPYKRYTQWLPIQTTGPGLIYLTAIAGDVEEKDALRKTLTIHPRRPATTVANYGTTESNAVTQSIQFPKNIHSDIGGLDVIVSPTVIGDIEGAFKYMRDYPYFCWEQKLSKGTMASHYKTLRPYLSERLKWKASEGLPEKTIQQAKEYQAPNGGMAYYVAKNEYVSPYLSAYTALAFNWLNNRGYTIPEEVEKNLHHYLLTLLRKNVMPDFYSKGMASTVRSVALSALAKQGKISRQDIRRYHRYVNQMSLFGKAQFLSAASQVPGTGRIRAIVADKILAHGNQTAGKFSFTETLDTAYKRMLSSSLRTQCAVLSSLSQYDATTGQRSQVGEIPFKLVRHITQTRKARGHWENTQENMFCMNALIDYARVYEKEQPLMTVEGWLDEDKLGETHFDNVKNSRVRFSHEMTADDVGREAAVKLEREGQGRLYYSVRLSYSDKLEKAKAVNAGIEVQREYHVKREGKWIRLNSPMRIKTGELVRVDLYVFLAAPRYFVVVDDPIPGGLEPVNRDLGTSANLEVDSSDKPYADDSLWLKYNDWEEYGGWWNFYHKELRHHAAIFYSDYLSPGRYHLSYVAQAIAPGEFTVMGTHAEEMYEPDIHGKGQPALLKVERE
jgi:alpha-2-macroglobulin